MIELKTELLTNKYTRVFYEEPHRQRYNAPHHFVVRQNHGSESEIGRVDFQEGPIGECGVNGVMNEDLLCMILKRLQSFQDTAFACYENEMAIEKITEALLWLRKRTLKRERRGIEGTNTI